MKKQPLEAYFGVVLTPTLKEAVSYNYYIALWKDVKCLVRNTQAYTGGSEECIHCEFICAYYADETDN